MSAKHLLVHFLLLWRFGDPSRRPVLNQVDVVGRALNIGGGSRITVKEVIEKVANAVGRAAIIEQLSSQHGDARHTWADTSAAAELLGFRPRVSLEEGLAAEAAWLRETWDPEETG